MLLNEYLHWYIRLSRLWRFNKIPEILLLSLLLSSGLAALFSCVCFPAVFKLAPATDIALLAESALNAVQEIRARLPHPSLEEGCCHRRGSALLAGEEHLVPGPLWKL